MDFETCIASHSSVLMEGALGERLKREYGLTINGSVAMADLIYSQQGRLALDTLWRGYMGIAEKYNLPFLATTPTRRANKQQVIQAGYDEAIIEDNVRFLRKINETSNIEMYIGGLMGCKGDAYTGAGALNIEEAHDFHHWQAQLFKFAKADFLYAGIMPVLTEATGMARAMSDTGIPYIISFTIQKDGKLIDGHTIDYAIRFIDDNVSRKPVCYMTNCVHPAILRSALSQPENRTEAVRARFCGIQANAACLSLQELDNSCALKTSDAKELAEEFRLLHRDFPLKIYGGCCGTDDSHIREMIKVLQ